MSQEKIDETLSKIDILENKKRGLELSQIVLTGYFVNKHIAPINRQIAQLKAEIKVWQTLQ